MIDGAHLITPGVLRFGMLGLSTYAPAIVTVKQWYLGPGQQPRMVAGGYDGEYEDRLLAEVGWPTDGYRLFEIGHFIGDRDWIDGDWESNCMFVPRELLEQVGAMDESFSVPGEDSSTWISSSAWSPRPASPSSPSSAKGHSIRCTAGPRPTPKSRTS